MHYYSLILSSMLNLPIDWFVYLWGSLDISFLFCAIIAGILYASVNIDLTACWNYEVFKMRRAEITGMCIFQRRRRFLEEGFSQRGLSLQIELIQPFCFWSWHTHVQTHAVQYLFHGCILPSSVSKGLESNSYWQYPSSTYLIGPSQLKITEDICPNESRA